MRTKSEGGGISLLRFHLEVTMRRCFQNGYPLATSLTPADGIIHSFNKGKLGVC